MSVAASVEESTRVDFRPIVAGSTLALPDHDLDGMATTEAGARVWVKHLRRLKRAGFSAIDLVDTWVSPGVLSRASLMNLRELLEELDLALVGVTVIRKSIIDPVDGLQNLDHTFASIEAAHLLGAPVICIGFHRPLTEEQRAYPFWLVDGPLDDRDLATYECAAERLRQVCRCAAQYAIAVSLELYEGTLLNTGKSAREVVRLAGEPNLGLNPDLANLYREPHPLSETWVETLAICAPVMNYWHIKNFCRLPAWPSGPTLSFPTSLATGDIDYRLALELVRHAGYDGPLCIEHYGGDRITAQGQGLAYITALLQDLVAEES